VTSHSELEAETGGDQRRDCSLSDADRQAWHDLAHINASMRRFESGEQIRAGYIVSHGFFKKGEIADNCADRELNTRELAERVMCERNIDPTDVALRNSVVFKVVQALRHAARRKIVVMVEKRKGICVWAAAPGLIPLPPNTLSRRGSREKSEHC
jgi:hypothetical protein